MVDKAEARHEVPSAVDSGVRLVEQVESSRALTVREWGTQWLDTREREGVRSIRTDRSRWRTHVETAPWIDAPLRAVTRATAREWLSAMYSKRRACPHHRAPPLLSKQTIQNVLNLVRVAFASAIEAEVLTDNPFVTLKVRRSRGAKTRQRWVVLRPHEQEAARAALSKKRPMRLLLEIAMGTCMRAGELLSLRVPEVSVDGPHPSIQVRYGEASLAPPPEGVPFEKIGHAYFLPTKGGKPRTVPLFGRALVAMREWLKMLSSARPTNPLALVFPREDGDPRRGSPRVLVETVEKAIGRHLRFHDLRHTGATSLLAGWWGRAWPLEMIQLLCGHGSVAMTERYAHWLEENEGLFRIASEMEATMVDEKSRKVAEEKGFEPLVPSPVRRFSKPLPDAGSVGSNPCPEGAGVQGDSGPQAEHPRPTKEDERALDARRREILSAVVRARLRARETELEIATQPKCARCSRPALPSRAHCSDACFRASLAVQAEPPDDTEALVRRLGDAYDEIARAHRAGDAALAAHDEVAAERDALLEEVARLHGVAASVPSTDARDTARAIELLEDALEKAKNVDWSTYGAPSSSTKETDPAYLLGYCQGSIDLALRRLRMGGAR